MVLFGSKLTLSSLVRHSAMQLLAVSFPALAMKHGKVSIILLLLAEFMDLRTTSC